MSTLAPAPELPSSVTSPSIRLQRASFPVDVTYLRHDVWSITEVIGGARVLHGHLRRDHGLFTITTASGTRAPERDWQALLARHLGTR